MWLHTDLHPLHTRRVHPHAMGQKKQISTLARVCIPHETDSKVGWLPPQTSAVGEGWHRHVHSAKGGRRQVRARILPYTHTHTLSPSVPGESQLCLTKCREGEDGGGCAAIQPYGRKHLLHRPRRGVRGGGGGARNKASRVHRELGAGWVSVWGRVNVSYQRVSERVGSRCPPHGEVEGH